jgi:toxin ParE1/3/4
VPVVLKREAAKRDLIQQWVWYAEHGGVALADRFLSAAEDTLKLLAAQPEIGAPLSLPRLELSGLRRASVSGGFEKILIFYLCLPEGIDLVRVIHGSRDLERVINETSC